MANDLVFGIRLTADGSAMVGQVRVAKAELDGLKGSATGAGAAVTQLGAASSTAGSLLGALTSVLSVGAVTAWAHSIVSAAADLNNLHVITGSSVEDLSRLSNIAIISGQGTDLLRLGLERLSYSMNSSDLEAGRAQKALQQLGISAKDPATAMQQLADKLALYADGTGKAAIVQDIMGRGAQNLLPLLAKMAEAHQTNATVTALQSQEAERFEQGLRRLSVEATGFRNALLDNIGTLADWIEKLREGTQAAGSFWKFLFSGASLADSENTSGKIDELQVKIAKLTETRDALQKTAFFSFLNSDDILIANQQLQAFTDELTRLQKLQAVNPGRGLNLPPGGDPVFGFTRDQLNYVSKPLGGGAQNESTLQSYYAYLQQQELAEAQSAKNVLGIQSDGYKRELAELNNYHALGLTSEQEFIDASSAAAKRDAEAKLAEQKALVTALLNQLSDVYDRAATTPKEVQDRETELLKLANAYTQAKYDAGRAAQALADIETKHAQDTAIADQKHQDAITAINRATADYTKALSDQSSDLEFQVSLLGKTQTEQDVLNAQHTIERNLRDQILKIDQQIEDLRGKDPAQTAALIDQKRQLTEESAKYGEQIKANTALLEDQKQHQQGLVDAWQSISGAFDTAAGHIKDGWKSVMQSLLDSFKQLLLKIATEIALKNFVVPIFFSMGGNAGALGSNPFSTLNAISSLMGGGSGGASGAYPGSPGGMTLGGGNAGSLLSGGSSLIGMGDTLMGGVASAFGVSLASTSASLATLGIAFEAGAAAVGGMTAVAVAAIPVVGWIAAAAIIAYEIFSKPGGGPKVGGSASVGDVSSLTALGTGNAGAGRFFTPNAGDASLTQFVQGLQTTYATALLGLGGKGTAGFALGYDTDPQGTAQSRVSGGVTVGGRQVYQQQNLDVGRTDAELQTGLTLEGQRVILAALKASDLPADIAKLFSSIDVPTLTSDQITAIEKTAATYALINNTLIGLPSDIQDHFTAMLDGTQAFSDDVLVVVSVIQTFGDSIEGLGPKLEALDPAQITAFIDALGGAGKAASAFAYLGQNFLTTADRLTQSTKTLNSDFAQLGITSMPQTHAEFLALLNSFDLTTEAGRTLYASVLALSPLFVAVHGTADQAAGGVNNLADATARLASATDFFKANFYTDAERGAKQYADDLKQVNDASATLGITIPTSVAGFRALIEGIDQSTDAGAKLYAALIVLAPAVFDLGTAATNAAAAVQAAIVIMEPTDYLTGIQNTVDSFFTNIANLAKQIPGADLGGQLGFQLDLVGKKMAALSAGIAADNAKGDLFGAQTFQIELAGMTKGNVALVAQLARFTVLTAQYGSAMAGQLVDLETWYQQQQDLLAGDTVALGALNDVFAQRWAAIIAGTSTGVTGTLDQLARLKQGIADYLKGLVVGDLSPLKPMDKLAQAKTALDAEYAKAQGGDQAALGDVTKFEDTYLKLARDAFASSQAYTDIFNQETQRLGDLAGVKPTGESYPVVVDPVLAAALPVGGAKLASQDDITAQTRAIIEALAAHADAGTLNTTTVTTAVQRGAVQVVDAVNSGSR